MVADSHRELAYEAEIVGLRESLTRAGLDAARLLEQAGISASENEAARRLQRLLLEELHHRVKNTLATVIAITSQTLRSAGTLEQGRAAIESRLFALGRAHDLLLQANWASAPLRDIIRAAVQPFDDQAMSRFSIEDTSLAIDASAVLPLTMSLNELCTNAVKYGALSVPAGRIAIALFADEKSDRFKLIWTESGGPIVQETKRPSFGTRLINGLAEQLHGKARLKYEPQGITYELDIPLSVLCMVARGQKAANCSECEWMSANGMVRPCSSLPAREAGNGRQRHGAAMSQNPDTAIAVIGIDIGKNSFHVVGLDPWRHRAAAKVVAWSDRSATGQYATMPDWHGSLRRRPSPQPQTRGARSRCPVDAGQIRPPYSKGQKNDFRDAEAIAEAVQRPTIKCVATKTAEQLDLQALHRMRERLVSQRTGIINQIRAFMLERGIAVRQGYRFLRNELPKILATPLEALSPRMLRIIEELAGDWRRLDQRIDGSIREIEALPSRSGMLRAPDDGARHRADHFERHGGRDRHWRRILQRSRLGAWLGLVPKQISTGDRTILGKISRRGNRSCAFCSCRQHGSC